MSAPVRAEGVPGGQSALTFPAWWSAPGGPAWEPEASLTGGTPWTYAGLTTGAWELHDPLAQTALPNPGVPEIQVPLAWYDSATVVVGEGAAWTGFGAGLAVASGWMKPVDSMKPRAVFTAMSGAHAVDRNGIELTRGNKGSWLRIGALADRRGGLGELDVAGGHLWCAAMGRRVGHNAVEVTYSQRGVTEAQVIGVGESATGSTEAVHWSWSRGGDSLSASYSRGSDTRTQGLAGLEASSGFLSDSRRESNQHTFEFSAHRVRGEVGYGLRVERSTAAVSQLVNYTDIGSTVSDWSTQTTWLAVNHTRPLGEGALDLTLGAGHDPQMVRASERNVVAPALAWRVDEGEQRVRVFFERVVDPVWSDLDRDYQPFLQHSWIGGFGADMGVGGPTCGSVQVFGGRTANRATVYRFPIRAYALGVGTVPDAHRYDFLELQPSFVTHLGGLALDASGFALARGRTSAQPRVDPALGGSLGAGGGFRLFTGDLGVRLHASVAYVGARESDTRTITVPGFGTDVVLPGYATYSATASLTLGDATIVLRGDDLEGVRRPLTWSDYTTGGLALDSGAQFRAEVVWPFFN